LTQHTIVRSTVYCGPLERTRETAEPLARRLHLPLHMAEEFNELDMGD
jgi:broad specificity phosphatase PhoE